MIRPPGFRATLFSTADDGDVRADPAARRRLAERVGIPAAWAEVRQVHGTLVLRAQTSGLLGEADGVFTTETDLPISVAVADCVPVIVEGEDGVGAVHAGWRGLAGSAVDSLLLAMRDSGIRPQRAAIGPAIGPCCYEVGPEVAEHFPEHRARTTWRALSVDLWSAAEAQLGALPVWRADRCTHCQGPFFSYRRDGTRGRQVGLAWLP